MSQLHKNCSGTQLCLLLHSTPYNLNQLSDCVASILQLHVIQINMVNRKIVGLPLSPFRARSTRFIVTGLLQ